MPQSKVSNPIDHGQFQGLDPDDDHPQYLRQAEGDGLYSTLDHDARHRSGGADELVKTARVAGTVVAAQATASVVVAWAAAFADTAYTVTYAVEQTAGTGNARRHQITAKVAASITVLVENGDALNSATVTVHAIAVHD